MINSGIQDVYSILFEPHQLDIPVSMFTLKLETSTFHLKH